MGDDHVFSAKSEFLRQYLPAKRRKAGLILAEGERVAREAMSGNWQCQRLFLERHFGESEEAQSLLRAAGEHKVPTSLVEARGMEKLSAHSTAPPVAALVSAPEFQLPTICPQRVLVLDGVADPGNAGTLLRSAAAFGFGCLIVEGGVTHLNEKFVRSSAGQIFSAGVYLGSFPSNEISAWLSDRGARSQLLDSHAEQSLHRVESDQPTALILGNEARGVSPASWPGADAVRIPMASGVESLNVAISGAIAMYELARDLMI